MTGDEMNMVQQAANTDWHHWVPFAALATAAAATPKNRPLTTRITEQVMVAVLAGGGSAYTVNDVVQAQHAIQIHALEKGITEQNAMMQRQIELSEARLTSQIMELRGRALK